MIRTPDQRLRVFVSSTLAELAEERRAVLRAVSAMGLTPVMFESGARPHPPQQLGSRLNLHEAVAAVRQKLDARAQAGLSRGSEIEAR